MTHKYYSNNQFQAITKNMINIAYLMELKKKNYGEDTESQISKIKIRVQKKIVIIFYYFKPTQENYIDF